MFRSDQSPNSRQAGRWAGALFVFYAVAATTTAFAVAWDLMRYFEVIVAVSVLIAAEITVGGVWAAVVWHGRVRRRRRGCAASDACVCGNLPSDGRDVLAHADQWIGWNTDGVADELTQRLRAAVAAAGRVPVRWTMRNWCHRQGWTTTDIDISADHLCCPVNALTATTADGRRLLVVRVGSRQPTIHHQRAGHVRASTDIDVVCGGGHRWTWFYGLLHRHDISYASVAQVFGPGQPTPLTGCVGIDRCTSPSRCTRRAPRCPLCASVCHLQPSPPDTKTALASARPADAAAHKPNTRVHQREFGREQVTVEQSTAADGSSTYVVRAGNHNLTGWQPLTVMPDDAQLSRLLAEPDRWGQAYPPLPGTGRGGFIGRVARRLRASIGRRAQTAEKAQCPSGCSCRIDLPTRISQGWFERATSQAVWLKDGRPRVRVQAWLDQRVAGRDSYLTGEVQQSPVIGYRTTFAQLRTWCERQGWTVHDQINHTSEFLEDRTRIVLATGRDSTRYAVVSVDCDEPVVYLDRTADPAAWRSVRPVVATCEQGHSVTWTGYNLLTDPVKGERPVAAVFGAGCMSPVQVCRSCTYVEAGHIDVFCDQHRGFIDQWHVPEAVYCPCGQVCELTLPEVAVVPGAAAPAAR